MNDHLSKNHDPYGNAMSGMVYKPDNPKALDLPPSTTILGMGMEKLQRDRTNLINRLNDRRDQRDELNRLIFEDEEVLTALDKAIAAMCDHLNKPVAILNGTSVGSGRTY